MRRITLPTLGPSGGQDAATVLDSRGGIVATIAEPITSPDMESLRDAVIEAVWAEDFGDVILSGVAFAPAWGGDAVGFT